MSITAECLIIPPEAPRRPWRSMWVRRGVPMRVHVREIAAAGALAVLVLAVVASGVLPLARHWRAREARVASRAAQLAHVRGLAVAERALAQAVHAREVQADTRALRPLAARSAARAGAALGVLVQQVAAEAHVQVERVELADARATDAHAAGADAAGPDAALVTTTVSAVGDVYGLTDLLQRLQRGPALVEVAALDVRRLPTLGHESLLQLTLTVRAVWSPR